MTNELATHTQDGQGILHGVGSIKMSKDRMKKKKTEIREKTRAKAQKSKDIIYWGNSNILKISVIWA